MALNFDNFVNWCEKRFGDVVISGSEIKINSIFTDDYKHHLWCNPEKREHGVYHCWKTDKKGTLIGLVMEVDHCSFQEALEILGGEGIPLHELEKQVDEMFLKKEIKEIKNDLEFPPNTHLISSLLLTDYWRIEPEKYLKNRKLDIENLYICTKGDYNCRIIIPYYNKDGKLIYWNGRHFKANKENDILRYQGPPKTCGIGKSDVIYMCSWPVENSDIYFTEGEFDAMSMNKLGFHAGALGGKILSEKQISLILPYKDNIILCLDNDKAGNQASINCMKKMLSMGFKNIKYIKLPSILKDWNEFLVKYESEIMKKYINEKKKILTRDFILN